MADERTQTDDARAIRDIVIEAARHYRDAMRRYLSEQVSAIEQGASLTDLATRDTDAFRVTARAEEELFALLDRLDSVRTSEPHKAHPTTRA